MLKVIKVLAILLASVTLALGQAFTFSDIPFISQGSEVFSGTPITLGATAWWEPSRGSSYQTNTGVGTLSNLTSVGASYNLINASGVGFCPAREINRLNGLDTLVFAPPNWLLCAAWTNYVPWEAFMVLSRTNDADGGHMISSSVGDLWAAITSTTWQLKNNTTFFDTGRGSPANKYLVVNIVFTTNSLSTVYTNNVNLGSVGNSGAVATAPGFITGVNFAAGSHAGFSLATMFTFSNRTLTASERLQAFQYCTNRFALTIP